MAICTSTNHWFTNTYIGMINIISMLMILLTRRANRTRTSIGIRKLFIRIRIIRIFITGTGTRGER